LGTDYPFPLGEVYGFAGAFPGKTIEAVTDFDDRIREKLLYKNALDFLGLEEESFK
jgi:aminocarboxymuconate-semialdehyde decarboxylase